MANTHPSRCYAIIYQPEGEVNQFGIFPANFNNVHSFVFFRVEIVHIQENYF